MRRRVTRRERHHTPTAVASLLAFAPAAIPIPGLGTLRIAPSPSYLLGTFAVTYGRLQLPLAIPGDPRLLGLELHQQALLIDPALPPRLSNAIVDRIQ